MKLDVNRRIARAVRGLRTKLGMSLDGLAGKSGVSRSMLSLVERGESSPTAVVLEKISAGLGVPLGRLFEDLGGEARPVSRAEDRTEWRDPESGYMRRNISPENFASPIQIVDVVLPAGARVAYEGVRDGSIHQQVWVRAGAVEVTVGKVTHRLEKDDCLAMRLNAPVAFRNRSRKAARYVVVVVAAENLRGRRK